MVWFAVTDADNPRVSIITPVFNGELFIRETMESVLGQTFLDYEHVIVDDGSTDSTLEVLRHYSNLDSRIRLFSQKNSGEACAVNVAAQMARGEYCVILNADDVLLPTHLETCVAILDSEKTATAVYPDWYMINAQSQIIRRTKTIEFSYRALLVDLVCAPGPGTMYRSHLLVGEPLRNPHLRYVSDYEMWTRVSAKGPLLRIPQVLAAWRLHNTNLTSDIESRRYENELRTVVFGIENEVVTQLDHVDLGRFWRRAIAAKADYFVALRAIADNPSRSRRLMLKSIARKPWRNRGYETEHRQILAILAGLLAPLSILPVKARALWRYRTR